MKKSIILVAILLGNFQVIGQQKTYVKVLYEKAFKNIRDNSNTSPVRYKNMDYVLHCNPTEARFEIVDIDIPANDIMEYEYYKMKGSGNRIFYHSLKTNEHLSDFEISGEILLVQEKKDKITWELIPNETKEILGYTCFKAIGSWEEPNIYDDTKKDTFYYTVWYSPQLALPFGPIGTHGLPGLILEIKNVSYYYIAKKIEFFDSPFKIEKPKGKEITVDKFDELITQFLRDKNITR